MKVRPTATLVSPSHPDARPPKAPRVKSKDWQLPRETWSSRICAVPANSLHGRRKVIGIVGAQGLAHLIGEFEMAVDSAYESQWTGHYGTADTVVSGDVYDKKAFSDLLRSTDKISSY